MVDIDTAHLHNKIKELLIEQCGKDEEMKRYLFHGGFDRDIDDFCDGFALAAADHDEDGMSDEEFDDKEEEE